MAQQLDRQVPAATNVFHTLTKSMNDQVSSTPQNIKNEPANKKIVTQRKYYSVKKKRAKKNVRFVKPTNDAKEQLFHQTEDKQLGSDQKAHEGNVPRLKKNQIFGYMIKSEANKIRLLADYDVTVERDKLRSVLSSANTKGPEHLLGRLVSLVFSTEELANSFGQGLHKTSATADNKEPLDSTKLSACKEYMTAFCLKNGKQIPSPKRQNMAITAQVTYARVKTSGRKNNK
ncbi:hypothetical protein AC249_AIPGENE23503 [Exaiptasia diaphana]|nr:hypothetical protein AC249_AIPGENE23503 [Exaiptasia diaphana]